MSSSDLPWSIDETLVRRLLAQQFPQWATLPLTRVASAGTDNELFRLGTDLAVRLPKRESAAALAEREQQWLPRLAPELPLEIPAPIGAGKAGGGYRSAWSVCRWLEGVDAATEPPLQLDDAAHVLGRFLVALREIDAADGPPAGRANHGRGVPLAFLDARVRRDVEALGDEIDGPAVLATWEEALAAPVHQGPGVWVHGDLHPSNLLVRDERIVAVLDFGLLGVGDPACDLFVAWSYLDEPARRVFQESAQVDEAAWRRGRGWAVYSAVIALAFYLRTNPTLCAMSRKTLAELSRGQ